MVQRPLSLAAFPFATAAAWCFTGLVLCAPTYGVDKPATPTTAPAPTYEFRSGRWIPLAGPATQPAEDVVLDRAEDLLQRGAHNQARKLLLEWFEARDKDGVPDRKVANRDRATFLFAESYYQYGNRILAFYHFDEVMDLFPESRFYYPSLQRQYDIADAYLLGYKRRFLKLAILGAEDEAIEMLYRIQNRSPGSPLAEKALLRTADFYYRTAQYDLAADAYGVYLKSYPRSPLVTAVRLRQAFSSIGQFRGTKFDPTPITDARQQLSDLIVSEPKVAADEGLAEMVDRIDGAFAQKLYQTGDFYDRTHQPVAAVYTWRYLVQTYPDSMLSGRAQARIAKMPASAIATTAPYSPASESEELLPSKSPTTGSSTRRDSSASSAPSAVGQP